MLRLHIIGLALAALLRLSSCSPSITVQNNTNIPVRVVLRDGSPQSVEPSPHESSSAETEEGPYTAFAIPPAEWISYAKATRQYLNDQITNSSNLTGPQLLAVVARLKDIAARMQQYEAAGSSGASCSGAVSQDANSVVTISQGADGKLVVTCK